MSILSKTALEKMRKSDSCLTRLSTYFDVNKKKIIEWLDEGGSLYLTGRVAKMIISESIGVPVSDLMPRVIRTKPFINYSYEDVRDYQDDENNRRMDEENERLLGFYE